MSARGPLMTKWEVDVLTWARAEEQALGREEIRGIRKKSIPSLSSKVLFSFEHPNPVGSGGAGFLGSVSPALPRSP